MTGSTLNEILTTSKGFADWLITARLNPRIKIDVKNVFMVQFKATQLEGNKTFE